MASDEMGPVRRPGGAARASENTRGTAGTTPQRPVPEAARASRKASPPTDPPRRRTSPAVAGTKPRRRGIERLVLSLGALATVGVLLTACTIGYFNWRLGQIRRINLELASAAAGQPQNYLVVGSDSRAGIGRKDPNSGGVPRRTRSTRARTAAQANPATRS